MLKKGLNDIKYLCNFNLKSTYEVDRRGNKLEVK